MESVNKIRNALGIEKEPVAVKYTDESPTGKVSDGQYAPCNGILEAANGKVIMLSERNCVCGEGIHDLGLSASLSVSLKLLVEDEKLWNDVKAATRSRLQCQKIAAPPLGIAKKVYLYPVVKNVFLPDLIIFLVNAEQVSRFITLAQFWDGKTPSFEMRGPLCWSSIAYPMVSGNFNITAGDVSSRRAGGWDKNTMIVSVPVEKIQGIADAIDKSTAGMVESESQLEKLTAR